MENKIQTNIEPKINKSKKSLKASELVASFETKNFGQLCQEWLLVFKKASVAPRTFEGILSLYNRHIKSKVGGLKLKQVTPAIVQTLINNLMAEGYSVATCKKIKFAIGQFFEYATLNGWAENNPVEKVKIRNKDIKNFLQEKYKAMPPEIRQQFLKALEPCNFLKTVCMLGMMAGLRIGEILALRWQNINFKNKFIAVSHSITQVAKFDDKGKIISKSTIIGHTKTSASVREIPIPDVLIETLKQWQSLQSKISLKNKEEQNLQSEQNLSAEESLVFSDNGSVKTYSSVRHTFNKFLKKHNLHKYGIQFHTLRHTYSSMLFETGENPKIIQALLGHKSVNTTLTVYNNIDKSYFKQATDRINNLFDNQNFDKTQTVKIDKSNLHNTSHQLQIEVLEQILQFLKEQEKEKIFRNF